MPGFETTTDAVNMSVIFVSALLKDLSTTATY